MAQTKIYKFCKFYHGEGECPTNVDYDCWFWERIAMSSDNSHFPINSENEFIRRIKEYMSKWIPYDCDVVYEKYLQNRQLSI